MTERDYFIHRFRDTGEFLELAAGGHTLFRSKTAARKYLNRSDVDLVAVRLVECEPDEKEGN